MKLKVKVTQPRTCELMNIIALNLQWEDNIKLCANNFVFKCLKLWYVWQCFFRSGHTSYLEGERCNAKSLRCMNKLRTVFQLEPLTNVYTPFM